MAAWTKSKSDVASQAIVLVNSVGADGKPIAGLNLTASPAMQRAGSPPAASTRFGYSDKEGGYSGSSSISGQTGPIQVVGITEINFQPAFPAQSNDHEPNVILTANPLAKDIVLPAFAGQVSYALIYDRD
jgi:hypothetical protein